MFLKRWNSKKFFPAFGNIFHVYLTRGFQKYARNWILTMAFWATCKIAQPIQPIWQHIFALPWSALKKPSWEFNFFRIFEIPSSSRHEKCCQIFQTLFLVFQYSRNSQWVSFLERLLSADQLPVSFFSYFFQNFAENCLDLVYRLICVAFGVSV